VIPRDRPSSSWRNGEPPNGMFAPPPSRPFAVPIAQDPQGAAPPSSKAPSGNGAKLAAAAVITLIAVGVAAAFFLRSGH
jgi:hypothetical protein